ncbi:hypothetical protein EG329_012971 [Mollisiaceae sp. DMI_Dod_QoI]|nr:hypothetical protein EG329_012971 [Helotiales sp. DMI_Dod_QoI]
MPKIAKIEYFRVPPRWLFVKITDDLGVIGWGEASLEGHTQAVEGCLDAYIERYTGMEADDIEHIWQTTWRLGFYRGGPVFMSALAGIDIALWDLKARRMGVPIYQLLGGKVRDKIKVYAWIGGDRPGDVANQAKARKAQGFQAVKMNGTEDLGWLDSPSALDECVERLKAVKALGMDAGIDFHGRVHKPMAKQLAKVLEPYRPLFIEEPLLSEHIEGIKSLSQQTSIPIALGERLHSRWDIRPFLEAGVVDILQPDISHCGGISEMRRIAAMAETYDVALAPHCPLGPIALAANVQVAAVTPNFVIQEMSLGIHYNIGSQDLTSYTHNPEVWNVENGYIKLMTGPGLGIEIDEDQVRRFSEGAHAWVSPGFIGPGGEVRECASSMLDLHLAHMAQLEALMEKVKLKSTCSHGASPEDASNVRYTSGDMKNKNEMVEFASMLRQTSISMTKVMACEKDVVEDLRASLQDAEAECEQLNDEITKLRTKLAKSAERYTDEIATEKAKIMGLVRSEKARMIVEYTKEVNNTRAEHEREREEESQKSANERRELRQANQKLVVENKSLRKKLEGNTTSKEIQSLKKTGLEWEKKHKAMQKKAEENSAAKKEAEKLKKIVIDWEHQFMVAKQDLHEHKDKLSKEMLKNEILRGEVEGENRMREEIKSLEKTVAEGENKVGHLQGELQECKVLLSKEVQKSADIQRKIDYLVRSYLRTVYGKEFVGNDESDLKEGVRRVSEDKNKLESLVDLVGQRVDNLQRKIEQLEIERYNRATGR